MDKEGEIKYIQLVNCLYVYVTLDRKATTLYTRVFHAIG